MSHPVATLPFMAYAAAPQPRSAFDQVVSEAMGNDGVFTYDEAVARGVSPWALNRALKRGRVLRLLPRVYVVAGSPPTWWRNARAAAAWSGGPLSHSSAAFALGLTESPGDLIEVTRPSRRVPPAHVPIRVHVYTDLVEAEVSAVRGIRVTHAARTILDIARDLPEDELESTLEAALRSGSVRIARLRWQLQKEGKRGRPGTAAVRRLLARREASMAPTDSKLEDKVWRWFCDTRLPRPTRQLQISDQGRHIARVDFAYPSSKLAIEALSYRWHSGRQEWVTDQMRERLLRDRGWRIKWVVEEDITKRGSALEIEIASLLGMSLF